MYIDSYSARRAAELCGFGTVAMLDYLERSGVFTRSQAAGGRGKRRRYNFRDLVVLKVIKVLLDNGASVASLKTALREFQQWRWRAEPTVLEDKIGGLGTSSHLASTSISPTTLRFWWTYQTGGNLPSRSFLIWTAFIGSCVKTLGYHDRGNCSFRASRCGGRRSPPSGGPPAAPLPRCGACPSRRQSRGLRRDSRAA